MTEKNLVTGIYGINVFDDESMRERLPQKTYSKLKNTIESGKELSSEVADVVANAMKEWAVERGATHYTHWFQPMTGITAEKHDSFMSPLKNGNIIMEFSGKELARGESDASSFPSGGLRATFEARGYTAWDCTSPAFLRETDAGITLCIPTVFCSYTGEALDKKTPVLRSMEAINIQAMRILRLFGNKISKRVITYVGAEQEYFLVDRELYKKRKDLFFTGRTLFGAMPPKGQELDDHYYGSIKERVALFMKEVNNELWKLGVPAKTQHNEVAPAQHELAVIYENTNIATDHNQLVMEVLKRVAGHHGLTCLLHEKPFAGVNGSGKHNNWSLGTDDGQNLLEPGKTPHENAQFLLFLVAVIKAVDIHADLLRMSASNPGNDYRLGGHEAPPAIISIFLGDQLMDIFEQIENGELTNSKQGEKMTIGVSTLPVLHKDATDRNRTSPFAFTGNKFEFRMVPSSASTAGPNFVINTTVADVLCEFADELEKAENFNDAVNNIIRRTVKEHKRVLFDGNGYSSDWEKEAEKRGLLNIRTLVDSVPAFTTEKSINLFTKHKVLSEIEIRSRAEIKYEMFIKQVNIEAKTMIEMVLKQIYPAVMEYKGKLAEIIVNLKSINFNCLCEINILSNIEKNLTELKRCLEKLQMEVKQASSISDEKNKEKAEYYQCNVVPSMSELRRFADELEILVDERYWPFPTYGELLFNI